MEISCEEEELTLLEYTRLHGITVDYTTELPSLLHHHSTASRIIDPILCFPLDASISTAINDILKERLTVNKETALLLREVYSLQNLPAISPITEVLRCSLSKLKQELPILETDHELDMIHFGNVAPPALDQLEIPFKIIHEENNEGFSWPSEYSKYPQQYDEIVRNEKLSISRESLVYLQDIIRDIYTSFDTEQIVNECLDYKSDSLLRSVTPPLLPLSPPLIPYIPSSPTNRVPISSDGSDSVVEEAKSLEQQIMAADSLELGMLAEDDSSMLLDFTDLPGPDLHAWNLETTSLKRKIENMKVQGPLTPPMFSSSPMKKLKSVSFAGNLHELIPNHMTLDDFSGDESGSIDIDKCFQELEAQTCEAIKNIENEKLSNADTIARVSVPVIETTSPVAPWDEYSLKNKDKHDRTDRELNAQSTFLARIKREDLASASSWRGLANLERQLRWNIFTTKMTNIEVNESLHGEMELDRLHAEFSMRGIVTSSSQIWKREGLRALDEESDEEEIEHEVEEAEDDELDSMIRRQRLQNDESSAVAFEQNALQVCHTREISRLGREASTNPDQSASNVQIQCRQEARPKPGNDLLLGGSSVTSALRRFMATRGKTISTTKNRRCKEAVPYKDIEMRNDGLSRERNKTMPVALERHTTKRTEDFPPGLLELKPCSIIVSTTLLPRRNLIKLIEQLHPQAELVYRDYSQHYWIAEQADFFLSPSTCLIFTSLQVIKQRALPGQPDRSPIKERMKALCQCSERMVVLVTDGYNPKVPGVDMEYVNDPSDRTTILELETFGSQLEGEVVIKQVRGSEEALAHAIVMAIDKYCLTYASARSHEIKMFHQETHWEQFMCRAGLNSYAARSILASLEEPLEVKMPQGNGTVVMSGLSAFIMMDAEDRVRYFQALLGGSRILRRLGRVLDQQWVSAAHNFQI